MTDNTPYIIVDNQKIPPIGRSPRMQSATEGKTRREDQPFGVVDRVTISRAAREKAIHQQAFTKTSPQDFEDLPPAPRTVTIPLLTYPSQSRITSYRKSED